MTQSFLYARDLCCESSHESLGDLTQEYSTFGYWIEELGVAVCPELGREHIEHRRDDTRRREDLIIREISKAGEDIRIIGDLRHE